jgi:hypothetical protein
MNMENGFDAGAVRSDQVGYFKFLHLIGRLIPQINRVLQFGRPSQPYCQPTETF